MPYITAAAFDGMQVTLTDVELPLLQQLQLSVRETLALQSGLRLGTQQQHPHCAADSCRPGSGTDVGQIADDAGADASVMWDPEDADSCDELDDFLAADNHGSTERPTVSGSATLQQPESSASQQQAPFRQGGAWDWVR
jgi:hypothetical protein